MSRLASRSERPASRHRLIGALVGCGGPDPSAAFGPLAIVENRAFVRVDALVPDVRGPFDTIARVADLLANEVDVTLRDDARAIVLGGDHSIAIGTWKGVARALSPQRFGLVWFDAHMDAHTPETSPSGNIHGMPLAVLFGRGDLRLVGVARAGAVLDPTRTVLVGVRSFEPPERELLDSLGVRVITMNEIRKRGPRHAIAEAFERVSYANTSFGVSIDLDVIDPRIAPGVATPVEGGLSASAIVDAVHHAVADPRCVAIEIAEFDPSRDRHGRTVALARTLVDIACTNGGVR